MSPAIVWTLTGALVLLGIAGSVLPALPGAPLIFLAAVLHRFLLPGWVSGWSILVLAVLALLSVVVDVACGAFGAKRFGGGGWAVLGAGLGAAVGMLASPVGLLVGAFLGAGMFSSYFERKAWNEAVKAGFGAALGFVVGTAARLGVALFMAAWLAADLLWS